MPKMIEITISADGNETVVEASGFKGKDCLAATAPYEKDLGLTNPDRKLKPEAHRTTKQVIRGSR